VRLLLLLLAFTNLCSHCLLPHGDVALMILADMCDIFQKQLLKEGTTRAGLVLLN